MGTSSLLQYHRQISLHAASRVNIPLGTERGTLKQSRMQRITKFELLCRDPDRVSRILVSDLTDLCIRSEGYQPSRYQEGNTQTMPYAQTNRTRTRSLRDPYRFSRILWAIFAYGDWRIRPLGTEGGTFKQSRMHRETKRILLYRDLDRVSRITVGDLTDLCIWFSSITSLSVPRRDT